MAIINHAVRLDRAARHAEAQARGTMTDEPCRWAVGA